MVKFVPYNAGKLTEVLAAGGRIQEIRIVTLPLRTEVHLVVRTVTPDPEPADNPANPVGVDMGIAQRVVLSNGFSTGGVTDDRTVIKKRQKTLSKHDHIHHIHKTNRHTLGRARKIVSLRKAHTRSRIKQRHSLHRLVHQLVAMLVANNMDGVAVENLYIGNMLRNHCLADRIQQQRWGMFLRMLAHKAARAGIKLVRVNPRHTSLECSGCGNRKPSTDLPLQCPHLQMRTLRVVCRP